MDEDAFRGYFYDVDDRSLDAISENESVRELFEIGWFDPDIGTAERIDARDILADIFADYGYDFDEVFDWQAWWEALYGG